MVRTLGTTSIAMLVLAVLVTILFYATVPLLTLPQVTVNTAVYTTVRLPVGQPYTDHAALKHPNSYLRAEECGLNPQITLYNPNTNRFADVCKTSAGLFAAFIYQIENGFKREVTAIEKDKMSRLEQVIQWLKNGKYQPELPPEIPLQ